MIEGWRRRREHVDALLARAETAREQQRGLSARFRRCAIDWLGQAETLAWLGVTGFVWGAKVQGNRRSDEDARPVRELAGAAWLVLSWRRLPQRLRRLIRDFDPARPASQTAAAARTLPGPRR